MQRSHDAAAKLRDALGDLEQADTETKLQRSADLLRRGYGPITDIGETEIASELQHLKEQLGEAQQAMSTSRAPADGALDAVERLRARLATLDRNMRGSNDSGGEPGRAAEEGASQSGGQSSQPASGQGGTQVGAPGGARRGAQAGAQVGTWADGSGRLSGPVGIVGPGGYRDGPIDGAWNAGNNRELPRRVAPNTATPSVSTPEVYREGMNELGKLRRAVGDDPESRRQVDELIRSMQKLDPKRFPGNPAMVDELYARVLSGVDRLELQLRHELEPDQSAEVRSESPLPVPLGYQAAAAEYFRRLSKNP